VDLSSPGARSSAWNILARRPALTLAELEAPPVPSQPLTGERALLALREEDAATPSSTAPLDGGVEQDRAAPGNAEDAGAPGGILGGPGRDTPGSTERGGEAGGEARAADAGLEPAPAVRRVLADPTAAERLLRQRAREAQAPGSRVENPCVRPSAGGCQETALDGWFSALDAVQARTPGRRAAAIVLGNSLISSDLVTDVVRDRLRARFGPNGPGLLLPERQSELGTRTRTGEATGDWAPHGLTQGHGGVALGLTGLGHESRGAGARLAFSVKGPAAGWLLVHQGPGAAGARVDLDGRTLQRVEPVSRGAPRGIALTVPVSVPAGPHALALTAEGSGMVVQGLWLERPEPGVSLSPVGVLSAGAPAFLKADAELFHLHLSTLAPELVVLMLGATELRHFAVDPGALPSLRAALRELVARVRRAAPGASCLVVGPIDAVRGGTADEQGLRTLAATDAFHAAWREEAIGAGCAWFDLYDAMGGRGSFGRFHERGWMHADLVHPDWYGGQVLGQLFADALLEAWRDTPPPPPPRPNPLEAPSPHPLARALAAFRAAQSTGAPFRVGVAGLSRGGASSEPFARALEPALASVLSRAPGEDGAERCEPPGGLVVEGACLGAATAEGSATCGFQGLFAPRGHSLWIVAPETWGAREEAGDPDWELRGMRDELGRLRASDPSADCLVLSPAADDLSQRAQRSLPGLQRSTRLLAEAAFAGGCLLVDSASLAGAGPAEPGALAAGLVDALSRAAEADGEEDRRAP
jgi:hypothetical protein